MTDTAMSDYDYDVASAMSGAGVGGFNVQLTGCDKPNNNNLPHGVCRRCEGYSPGFGPCYNGITGVIVQSPFGDVDCGICSRCKGTGKEPATYIWDGKWYKPWTWNKGHYEVL